MPTSGQPQNFWVAMATSSHVNAFMNRVASRYSVRTSKIKKMLDQCQKQEEEMEVPAKRIKLENKENDRNEINAEEENLPTIWLSLKEARIALHSSDKEAILRGERLNDIHILFAQTLLRQQFPGVQGLSCTLTQNRLRFDIDKERVVQVCHVRQL